MRPRRAFTVLEVVVAIGILSVAMVAIVHMVRITQAGMRRDRQWTAVSQTLDATMATLVAKGHDALTPGRDRPMPVPAEIDRIVPGLRVSATVASAGVHLKTITLTACWQTLAGRPSLTARLQTQVAARRRQGGAP